MPATPETLWYGASTTKAHVAAALAHLIDSKDHPELAQGWETPISSIIRDDFVLRDEWATNHLTLNDAVSHRTGMARHEMAARREVNGTTLTPRDVVRNLRNLAMTAEPRVTFYYCNMMYVALSHVVETITGKWLGHTLKELIWGPLGMASTYFDLQEALDSPEHLAAGYVWDEATKKYRTLPFVPVTEVSGAGAIFSTALDYAKWVKCLLHQSEPLSKAAHKDIRTPRMLSGTGPKPGLEFGLYGLAWSRSLHHGHVVYSHNGGTYAYGAEVFWFPDAKFGVVTFANTATTSNAVGEILSWKLIDDKLGIPEADRFDFAAKYVLFVHRPMCGIIL